MYESVAEVNVTEKCMKGWLALYTVKIKRKAVAVVAVSVALCSQRHCGAASAVCGSVA